MRRVLVVVYLAGCGRFGFGEDAPPDAYVDRGLVEITMRGSTACARSGDGRVACWGSNAYGECGVGSSTMREAPALLPLENIVRIATGEYSAFAIDADGALFGWGSNESAQLGLGAEGPPVTLPTRIPVPEPVVDVAGGQFHTCAVTNAGELYCWGANRCGEVGTGDMTSRDSPFKVPGVSGVARVTVNDAQTCIVDAAGNVRCMGVPYTINNTCQNPRLTPEPLVGVPVVRDIQGGCHQSTCAVDPDGVAWCWGDNVSGVLGDGAATARVDPTRVAVISNIEKVATGFESSCAVSATNDVFCWGGNTMGQVGVGNTSLNQTNSPLQLPFFTGFEIDQIEVGCAQVCVRSNSDVYCWGFNNDGVVNDTSTNAYSPVLRMGLPF
jgi:alpha-tubulin suppressor-like RCC1 family protein